MASAWPSDDLTTAALDANTDTLTAARLELYAAVNKLKTVLDTRGAASGICGLDSSQLVANSNIAQGTGCLIYAGGTQSISSGGWQALSFLLELYDDNGYHEAGTPTRITIPAGVSRIRLTGQACFDGTDTTATRRAEFVKNGTRAAINAGYATAYDYDPQGTASLPIFLHLCSVFTCSQSDYFELQVTQNTGGSINTYATSPNYSWICLEVLRT